MTDNLPAVVDPAPKREVALADTDSWTHIASDVIRLANLIAPTEFVPRALRDSAPATAAAILYGREVGLPPMTALTMTHVIEGRPAMSAEAMRGLILAAGHALEVVETNRGRCVLRGKRYGQERWTQVEVSIDEFRHLTGNPKKPNWQLYPRQMLQARATVELARLVFPDVIHGFRAIEEFDDVDSDEPESDQPTRATVKRATAKKTTAKKTAAPVETPAERPQALAGPPLPGEDGFEAPQPQATAPEPPMLPVGGDGEPEGEASEPAPPAGEDAPDCTGDETGSEGSVGGSSDPEAAPERRGPRKATRAQLRMIEGSLTTLGVDNDRDERHLIAGALAGRAVTSMNDLTSGDASKIIDTLARVKDKDGLNELLDAMEDAKGDEDARAES